MSSPNARLEALRSWLHATPSLAAWAALCDVLDAWPPGTERDLAVDYAAQSLRDAAWPDDLRPPPPAWREAWLRGEAHPAWGLVAAVDVLLEAPGPQTIQAVRLVRAVLPLSLGAARNFLDERDQPLGCALSLPQAQDLCDAFARIGGRASTAPAAPHPPPTPPAQPSHPPLPPRLIAAEEPDDALLALGQRLQRADLSDEARAQQIRDLSSHQWQLLHAAPTTDLQREALRACLDHLDHTQPHAAEEVARLEAAGLAATLLQLHPPDRPERFAALRQIARADPRLNVSFEALRALTSPANPDLHQDITWALDHDHAAYHVLSVLTARPELADATLDALIRYAGRAATFMQEQVLGALLVSRDPRARPWALQALRHPQPALRLAALRFMHAVPHPDDAEHLLLASFDADPAVAAAATPSGP